MKQVYYSDVSDTAPTLPATATEGFPQDGTVSGNAQATTPGAYWFYQVSSELENAIKAGGKTPDASKVNQLGEIISTLGTQANAVSFLEQSLTDAQKVQARKNIGAAAAIDVATIADFGATADGVTDDSQAMIRADASGCKTLDLRGATVATTYLPENISLKNGYLVYKGQFFNVEGNAIARGGRFAIKNLGDLRVLYDSGDRPFPRSSYAAQGLAYVKDAAGAEHFYMAIRTYGVNNSMDRQLGTIAEYVLTEEGATVDYVAAGQFLPIGHSQGMGARVASTDTIFLYANEAGIPDRYLGGSTNYGKGFTRIRWRGNETTAADVVNFRLMPLVKGPDFVSTDNRINARMLTPCVTPDSSKIILIGGGRVWIYDLQEVEACTTEDAGWSWDDAGSGSPSTDTESQDTQEAYWCVPGKMIDATSVQPITSFPLDNSTARAIQAVASDGTFIYTTSGAANPNTTACVDVYDFNGRLVSHLWHNGARSFYTQAEMDGSTAGMGLMTANEAEGITIRGDELVCLFMSRYRTLGDIVSYEGQNYAAIAGNKGVCPDTYATSAWVPTAAAATKGEWSASASYVTGGGTDVSQPEKRFLVTLTPYGNSIADDQVKPITNAHVNAYFSKQAGHTWTTLKGENFEWKYENPYTGSSVNRYRITPYSVVQHPSLDESENRVCANWKLGDQTNKTIAVYMRQYADTDPLQPGELWFRSPSNVSLGGYAADGQRVRVSSSLTGVGPKKVVADGSTWTAVFGEAANSTGYYFHGINRNVILARSTYTEADGYALQIGVGLYRTSFNPYYSATVTRISLGSASSPWSQVFADTSTIGASDERKKDNIADPKETLMRAWGKVNFKVFQFKDALAKKGAAARIHVGVIAQQVRDAFASEGLDADRYGLFCYDKWDAKPAETDPETGEVIEPAVEAGDSYGIRYEEALALECAYQRWRLEKLEAKIDG